MTLEGCRLDNGELMAYAWPGGYPVYYLDQEGSVLCPACANRSENNPDELGQFRPAYYGVLWEGAGLDCDQCSKVIESAYGEPDAQ